MPFDFTTLITDRSQGDLEAIESLLDFPVSKWTAEQLAEFNLARAKGSYNYTDLNRVTEAMEYLDESLRGYGYDTGYVPIVIQHKEQQSVELTNLVPNSSFEQNADWSAVVYSTEQAMYGARSSQLSGTTVTSAPLPLPIAGHKYYGRTHIKSNGNIGAADNRFEYFAGDGVGLNWIFARNDGDFPDWTMLSSIQDVTVVNGTSYVVRNFVVSAQNTCWTDGLMILDLTASFGVGNEPTKDWCDANIPYFDGTYTYQPVKDPYTWYEDDIPTQSQMAAYLANVTALRSALTVWADTPSVPADMAGLTYQEANDIETILGIIETLINNMAAAWFYSGDVYSGEVDD